MSLHWSTTDSSHQREESVNSTESSARKADAGSSQPSSSRATPALQTIGDFDFETLIELLGTSSSKGKTNVDGRTLSGVEKSLGDISDLALDQYAGMQGNSFGICASTPPLRRDEGMEAEIQGAWNSSSNTVRGLANVSARNRECSEPDAMAEFHYPPQVQSLSHQRMRASSIGKTRAGEAAIPERSNEVVALGDTNKKSFSKLSRQVASAVSEAEQQLAELRSRVDLLRGDAKNFAPRSFERAFGSQQQDVAASEVLRAPGAQALPSQPDLASANADFVDSLNEQQAKALLRELIFKLNFESLPSPSSGPDTLSFRIEQLLRALRFVSEVDNIVWRASRSSEAPSKSVDDIILGQDNMRALLDRIRLWERTSRSRFVKPN